MWTKTKEFVKDANFHWRDAIYILVIGILLMIATDMFTHWICT